MWSEAKGSKSKANINCGPLKLQNVWSHNFPSLAAFLGTTPTIFQKYMLDFLMKNLILNQLVPIKIPKMKSKKACMPSSIFSFLFYFEVILIKQCCFLFFSQFGSQSEAEKLPSSNKKKYSWIIFKGKSFRAERKNILFYYI